MKENTVLDQMQEVIKKSLPQQTADQLKVYFKEQEELAKANQKLQHYYDELLEKVDEFKRKDAIYKSLEFRQNTVEKEEHVLSEERLKFEEEKRDFKCDKLQYQLDEAKKRSDDSFKILDTLVRNPRSTEFWSSNKNVPIQNKYADGSTYDTFHNINETITKDVEEHK